MRNRLMFWMAALLGGLMALAPAWGDDKLKKEELDQLLAPIALYPDDLLTNVLIASTYPLDVVQASRWRQEPANAKLKGDALTTALEAKDWDPSVKALVQFPDVLKTMNDKLDWTQKLGDAFLAQQSEVMDEIQFLRAKADEAGHLKSTKQQKVKKEGGAGAKPVYVIEPATPETIYVPVYQPSVVYGTWWYPDYPPYYWTYPGAAYVDGFFWAAGIAIAADIWDWNHVDWHHHDIDIDVDKWNRINVDRDRIANDKWEHRPDHRGPVPYRNKETREKFKQAGREPIGNKDFRGRDRSEIKDRLKDTDHSRIDDRAGRDRDKAGDRARDKARDRAGDRPRDKAGDRTRDAARDKAGGRTREATRDRTRDATRSKGGARAKPRKPASNAFEVKRGSDVRRHADRGRASRVSMSGSPRARAGGGPRMGGGRGGGRRR